MLIIGSFHFRGRVFAAELALLTLTMAASNYITGEMLDRFDVPPRVMTISLGLLFLLPGIVWFVTRRWWDKGDRKMTDAELANRERKQTVDNAREISIK